MKCLNRYSVGRIIWTVMVVVIAFQLAGCSGLAKGITEAVIDSKKKTEDTRQCWVRGRKFEGLQALINQEGDGLDKPTLKVLMVHGIGSHKPGHSARLAENLARELKLDHVQEKVKEILLMSPRFPDQNLGVLRTTKYMTADGVREMLFFELTWAPIVEEEKQTIDFDNSGEYSFRRTGFNNTLKLFVNDTIPDVLIYNGRFRLPVQTSVGQAMCWMMSETWETMPNGSAVYCDAKTSGTLDRLQDQYVVITHSLGSRIATDALQTIASLAQDAPSVANKLRPWKEKHITMFMLSNQLPLLQLGQEDPEVHNKIAAYCGEDTPEASYRLFRELQIVAFSDPNDLFSYAIPPNFIDDYIDSRLCPTLTNVILNVASINDVFGMGEFANPLAAHTEYDNDKRVIGLIANGIGAEMTNEEVRERCEWMEAIPEDDGL